MSIYKYVQRYVWVQCMCTCLCICTKVTTTYKSLSRRPNPWASSKYEECIARENLPVFRLALEIPFTGPASAGPKKPWARSTPWNNSCLQLANLLPWLLRTWAGDKEARGLGARSWSRNSLSWPWQSSSSSNATLLSLPLPTTSADFLKLSLSEVGLPLVEGSTD